MIPPVRSSAFLLPILCLAFFGMPVDTHAQQISADGSTAPVRTVTYSGDAERPTDTSPTLVERYQRARLQMLAERMQRETQGRVAIAGPERFRVPSDSLRPGASGGEKASAPAPSFPVSRVRAVRKLERGWYRDRFSDTRWSFLGAGRHFTPIDTTLTRRLRAQLQAHYGDPTQVLADFNLRKPRDEYVQFEYWLVVNDSIPVKISDANGARDRGLIVATSAEYRDDLFALRQAVLEPALRSRPAPYVDYYFESETRRWYRTGYDGSTYFLDPMSRYRTTPGQRPRLDAQRSAPSGAGVSSASTK